MANNIEKPETSPVIGKTASEVVAPVAKNVQKAAISEDANVILSQSEMSPFPSETIPSPTETSAVNDSKAYQDVTGTVREDFTTNYRGCVMNFSKGKEILAPRSFYLFLSDCPVDWQ